MNEGKLIQQAEMVYTVNEVAEILRCGINYVYKLINTGQLKCMKLPKIKVRRSTLEEFLERYEGYDLTDPEKPVLMNKEELCGLKE